MIVGMIKKLCGIKQCAATKTADLCKHDDVIDVASLPRMERHDVERLFARLFLSEDGQKILSYLQATIFQRAMPADCSDAQLRHMEGQRALLVTIQRLALSGSKSQ